MTISLPADTIRNDLLCRLRDAHREHGDPRFGAAALELLRPEPSRVQRQRRIAERDVLIRRLAATYPATLLPTPLAAQIARDLSRYSASAWFRERSVSACPHDPNSKPGLLWEIMRAQSDLYRRGDPLAERQIFNIVNGD